tara:strand:+ start:85 stop:684 length:600 start_codon:yes stop_codon:yes gene_type:complete
MDIIKKIVLILFVIVCTNNLYGQDIIIYKNGDDLKVKVLKITKTEIVYKKFTNLNGPEYTEEISNIFMIKYENGSKDVFNKKTTPNNNSQTNTDINNSKENKINNSTKECSSDSLVFRNNKYIIVCTDNNKMIRYATSEEVKNGIINNTNLKNSSTTHPCGKKPEAPASYGDPQYKQSPKYKKYKRKLAEWEKCREKNL